MNQIPTRRRAALAIAVAITVAITGAAFADAPEADPDQGAGAQRVTVTPSTNLANNQSVQVSGTGFPVNNSGTILICSANDDSVCIENQLGTVQTNASGAFGPVTVNLPSTFRGAGPNPQTPGPEVNCLTIPGGCKVFVIVRLGSPVQSSHRVTFAGGTTTTAPTTTTTAPTTTTTAPTTTTTAPTTTTTAPTTTTTAPTTTTTTSGGGTTTTAPTTTTTAPTTTTTTSGGGTTTTAPTTTTTTSGGGTTTTAPTTTTTTSGGGTTTTTPPAANQLCDSLRQLRTQFNAQVNGLVQSIAALGPFAEPFVASVEQARASGNASIDQALARSGCSPA